MYKATVFTPVSLREPPDCLKRGMHCGLALPRTKLAIAMIVWDDCKGRDRPRTFKPIGIVFVAVVEPLEPIQQCRRTLRSIDVMGCPFAGPSAALCVNVGAAQMALEVSCRGWSPQDRRPRSPMGMRWKAWSVKPGFFLADVRVEGRHHGGRVHALENAAPTPFRHLSHWLDDHRPPLSC